MKIDTIVSIKEMAEVSAAKNTNKKKMIPMNFPNGMDKNTFGNVINISPGPAESAL
jgi:hypothetical protein